MLTSFEREHLYLIAVGHTPEVRYQARENISPRIQHVLDALEHSPAFVRTGAWDLVAWNRAAAAVLGFDGLVPEQRNLLRRMFIDPSSRVFQLDWQSVARFAVATFRADTARAGASASVKALVDELRRLSPEFEAIWQENDVRIPEEVTGTKKIRHPAVGMLALEYSTFAVDGRTDLNLVIFNPATPKDVAKIRKLMKPKAGKKSSR